HQLALEMPAQQAYALGDRKRLVQVLANLLNNAAKYTPEGGRIAVRMEAGDQEVAISVSDNGIGIAPNVLPRVFDLFAQAEGSSDRSQGGLGLGLAVVKSLVDLHGGRIAARSEGIGKGTTFTFFLPRLAGSGQPPAPAASAGAPSAPRRPLRVLIVDDNADAA